jgi:tetratricopeptide (TPR) repeat protein
MSDGAFPDRLAQLRTRWESDPSSRVFLQLAEEYRHQGRVKEALAVLDKGLKEHPGYLSALVAKGRCHLELREGEAARAVLERVVKQDATQMVANKLLVRAYLETGEPARARERLDLYSLLNDSDPEIADLRRQIKAMDRPPEPAAAAGEISKVSEDSPFDLGAPPSAPAPADDIFDFGPGPAAVPAAAPANDDLLFPEISAGALRQRYLTSLASEGIFEIGPVPESASEVPIPATTQAPFAMAPIAPPALIPEEPPLPPPPDIPDALSAGEDTSWLEEAPAPPPAAEEPVFDFESVSEPLPAPKPPPPAPFEQAADLWPEESLAPEPEPELPTMAATATLGDLYLRQGHVDEAERIFQEVLEREPDNSAARDGLGRIGESRRPPEPEPIRPEPEAAPLDARRLLAGYQPGPAGRGTTARKIFLLNRYLDRLRGGQPDVR